jgi:LPXTG-motif cell wall-anchored protein
VRRRLRIAARRGVLAVTLTALASMAPGTATALAAPAVSGAEPIAGCTATTGVIVAVDFTSFGGAVKRACVANPATGEAALQQAGLSPVSVSSLSGFFVCQLTDPATGTAEPQTSCVDTPPVSAYWTYWHGLPGQSTWTYSQSGAASYQPPAGSIELWAFGSTVGGTANLESCLPSPTAIRNPGTSSVTAPVCRRVSMPQTAAPGRPHHSGGRAPAGHGPEDRPVRIADVATPSTHLGNSGSPVGLIAGIGGVALLGGGAGVFAWRRRRRAKL